MFQDPEKFRVQECFLEGVCEIKLEVGAEAQNFGKLQFVSTD